MQHTGRGIVSGMMDHSRQLRWAQPGQQRHKNIAKKVECACTAALSVVSPALTRSLSSIQVSNLSMYIQRILFTPAWSSCMCDSCKQVCIHPCLSDNDLVSVAPLWRGRLGCCLQLTGYWIKNIKIISLQSSCLMSDENILWAAGVRVSLLSTVYRCLTTVLSLKLLYDTTVTFKLQLQHFKMALYIFTMPLLLSSIIRLYY